MDELDSHEKTWECKVVSEFLAKYTNASREAITYALRRVAQDFGLGSNIHSAAWSAVSGEDVHRLTDLWAEQGLSVATIQFYVSAFKALARVLFAHGLITAEQYVAFRSVRPIRGKHAGAGRWQVVERKVRTALLRAASEDPRAQGVRDAALIAVLFGAGIRRSEVVRLQVEHINLDQGALTLVSTDGDHDTVHLAEWALPYLCAWLSFRSAKKLPFRGPLFCRISKGGTLSGTPLTGRGVHFICKQVSKLAGLSIFVRPQDARMTLGATIIEEHGLLVGRKTLRLETLRRVLPYDHRPAELIREIVRKSQ